MKSTRPYLLRALYDWILDSNCTPYIVVAADAERVEVPDGYAKDGRITLNVSPTSVRNWQVSDALVSFDGRFGGIAHRIAVPPGAVLAIYARETGQGMAFELETTAARSEPDQPPPGGPSLRVVK